MEWMDSWYLPISFVLFVLLLIINVLKWKNKK